MVRYTEPGAVMKEDSMGRWRSELKLQTNAVELQSWDYRTLDSRPVSAMGTPGDGPNLNFRRPEILSEIFTILLNRGGKIGISS